MGKSKADSTVGELLVASYADGLQATGTLDFGSVGAQQIEVFTLRPRDAFPSSPELDGLVMTEHRGYKKLFTFQVACALP
jgi:hypothetical protein